MSQEKIAVVGGGLVGGVLACYMAQKGYDVHVFERRDDIRTAEISAGKSINLALSDRGWKALRDIGLEERVQGMVIPMEGRMIHYLDGREEFQLYANEGQAINSVSRGGLNQVLLEKADSYDNTTLHFNEKCLDIDLKTNTIHFENSVSGQKQALTFDRIMGTDGAFSAVRSRLQKTDRFDYSQKYLDHSYKELVIHANPDGTHQMHANSLHIWPRGQYMLIGLPNLDGSFTMTLFFPHEGEISFASLDTDEKVLEFFKEQFPDAMDLMPTLIEDYRINPTSSLAMIHCYPWHYKNQIVMMGDATHATVPFYGQGMNSGFEDCFEFNKIFEANNRDWDKTFEQFSVERKPNGDAVIELSLMNYIVMRDLTADPEFLLQKRIEKWFAKRNPNLWMPLYEQVSFSDIPYSDALKRGQLQDNIMKKVLDQNLADDAYENEETEKLMIDLLAKNGITA